MKNSFFNFSRARTSNTATLTDVLLRSALGVTKYPDDPAPPRPAPREIALDYPRITAQPEYAVEYEKLNRFNAQMDKAVKDHAALQAEFSLSNNEEDATDEGAISKAETLLAGEKERDLQAEIRTALKLIEALRDAAMAQRAVLHRMDQALSRAAAQHYSDEHKAR